MIQMLLTAKCNCGKPDCGMTTRQNLILVTILNPGDQDDIRKTEEVIDLCTPLLEIPLTVVDATLSQAVSVGDRLVSIFETISKINASLAAVQEKILSDEEIINKKMEEDGTGEKVM